MNETVKQYLLPNEDARHVCQIQSGFLVFSSRRAVLLKEIGKSEYQIVKAIPYDCITDVQPKTSDSFEIFGTALDRFGCHTKETSTFVVKTPRVERGENKAEVLSHFQSTMNQCNDIVEEIKGSEQFTEEVTPTRDYSYLERMPESLTRNAMLDLNTVLRDQPVHDRLVHEAEKLLGNDPFLLEESLRDGNDKENGVLFAAGKHGYYWIQGRKSGRFMKNVVVDTVEWDNIRCFVHQWQNDDAKMDATYTLTKYGKDVTIQYLWQPTNDSDSSQYPWLLQPLNGPLILADVMHNYSGKHMPTSRDDPD
jgi:hypothetical protein